MNNQLSKFRLKKLCICKKSGFIIPKITSTIVIKDKIQLLPLAQLNYAVENNFISPDTLYFNNLVATKEDLLTNWIIPVKQSWLAKKINSTV